MEGHKPVIMDTREGPQFVAWQWTLVNRTPFADRRLIFGVFALEWPSKHPNQSFRSSILIIKTFGRGPGRFLFRLNDDRSTKPDKRNKTCKRIFHY